jgi:hypothetical protein
MSEHQRSLEADYVRTREGPYAYSRETLEAIKRRAIRDFFFSPKRLELAFRVLPNFFTPRDIDAAMLVNVISSGLTESELADPVVARRLHRYFLVAERFSERTGFFV